MCTIWAFLFFRLILCHQQKCSRLVKSFCFLLRVFLLGPDFTSFLLFCLNYVWFLIDFCQKSVVFIPIYIESISIWLFVCLCLFYYILWQRERFIFCPCDVKLTKSFQFLMIRSDKNSVWKTEYIVQISVLLFVFVYFWQKTLHFIWKSFTGQNHTYLDWMNMWLSTARQIEFK